MYNVKREARNLVSLVEQSLMQEDYSSADCDAERALQSAYKQGVEDSKKEVVPTVDEPAEEPPF